MLQCSYMVDSKDRKEYLREYRRKNRERLNAYQRAYFADPEHKKKHNETCRRWRKERMTDETKEKIKEYQKEYYKRNK